MPDPLPESPPAPSDTSSWLGRNWRESNRYRLDKGIPPVVVVERVNR
jgi:hypothetical protein